MNFFKRRKQTPLTQEQIIAQGETKLRKELEELPTFEKTKMVNGKPKLTLMQKIRLRGVIGAYREKLVEVRKIADQDRAAAAKPLLVEHLVGLAQDVDILDEREQVLHSKEDFEKKPIGDLLEMFDEALKALETLL